MTQREKIHELLDIVLDGNGLHDRRRDMTGRLPTVFFNFSGHVSTITITLHKDGWTPGIWGDKDWSISTDHPIQQSIIDDVRKEVENAVGDGDELGALRRDIEKAEGELARKKNELKKMKQTLKQKEKKNEAHD